MENQPATTTPTRETRVFVLEHSKKEVTVYTYLKAREMVNITTKPNETEQTSSLFEVAVVSIGAFAGADKYNHALDELRAEDYLQIVGELTGLIQQTTGQKKTTS